MLSEVLCQLFDVKEGKSPTGNVFMTVRIEQELADMLEQYPNKSDFVRKAILAQMAKICPLCHGKGEVFPGNYAHYVERLNQLPKPRT